MCDFGLSRFNTGSNMSTLQRLRGTYAYCAPEVYNTEQFSTKSDVYRYYIDSLHFYLQITNYILQIENYKLRIVNYKLRIANYELRIANCELRIANCELRIANCELRIANCKFQFEYILSTLISLISFSVCFFLLVLALYFGN